MILKTKIVRVTVENIAEYPQAICYINPKNEFFSKKVEWLKEQFQKGLIIKLLYLEDVKRPVGFIEYVPGEYCWRPVNAKNYMFIHCLWTNGRKYQHQGLGTSLIAEAEKDATEMFGMAAVTSDQAFMANKTLFLKNGYTIVAETGKEQLLVKQWKTGPLPSVNESKNELEKYQELTMIYSRQCPWVARFMEEVKPVLREKHLKPKIIELKTAEEAHQAPSLYGVFHLIYQGRLLADRYISTTRFKNIINKEMK
ncbi:GNAT family N-acetyltransferase [bacterium]|nr:GNAT family N-acetyltransferase [bacterium]